MTVRRRRGALATNWHSNKFLHPARDGAVLPILHLNGFKIANPTCWREIGREELTGLLRGYGHEPYFVAGDDPMTVHQQLVIVHLGHGASVTAVAHGASVDTSMGLTPTGGVIMSTRCGDIDPGVLAYLVREKGYDAPGSNH